MEIKYNIGDKVRYRVSKYNEATDEYDPIVMEGYISTILIKQRGVFLGKKGFEVAYKLHHTFEGVGSGWRDVPERAILERLGEHVNATLYRTKL